MFVGVCQLELLLSESRSLKDKRRVVKSLQSRISHRFNVSVSEVDNLELHRRASLAVSYVGNSRVEVEKALNKISAFAEANSQAEIIRSTYSFFNPDTD
jgi:hypothetical protein